MGALNFKKIWGSPNFFQKIGGVGLETCFLNSCINNKREMIKERWQCAKVSGKLAPIYSEVKKEYREESYISAVEYYKYRSAITKFRISAHNLPIEKGRW